MKKIHTSLLAFSLIVLVSCGKDAKEIPTDTKAIPVTVSGITANNTNSFVTASGKIEAENSANVSTRMMGYVTKVQVKVGQKVSAGQLLVSINNTDLQAKKAQIDASILQATAVFNNAKKSTNCSSLTTSITTYGIGKLSLNKAKYKCCPSTIYSPFLPL